MTDEEVGYKYRSMIPIPTYPPDSTSSCTFSDPSAKEAEIILLGKTAKEWALIEHENIELKAKVQELEKFIEDQMEQLIESVKERTDDAG